MFHIKTIEIISKNLREVVEGIAEGREEVALGSYIVGIEFFYVDLGIVHSMIYPLGALYDTSYSIADVIILSTVLHLQREQNVKILLKH